MCVIQCGQSAKSLIFKQLITKSQFNSETLSSKTIIGRISGRISHPISHHPPIHWSLNPKEGACTPWTRHLFHIQASSPKLSQFCPEGTDSSPNIANGLAWMGGDSSGIKCRMGTNERAPWARGV